MYNRLILLPKKTRRSLFLWGPRQVGKSTWLRHIYPQSLLIDLLKSDEFLRFTRDPSLLRTELQTQFLDEETPVIIDEVQKIPLLLDEVHWLIENKKTRFVLCGSNARKLKRGHANLLGGRALRYEMHGLVAQEIGETFDLTKMLNRGYLPEHYDCKNEEWSLLIRSYVGDYLKEEIAAEAATKNLPAFTSFLESAAFSDTETVNFATIARDVGVSGHTIKEYFEILADTHQGSFLPAYTERSKRRTRQAPKFYFHDVGVVNYLAKRKGLEKGSELFGKAFENYIFHELNTFRAYQAPDTLLSYWGLTTGREVDFIINDMEVAIEAKSSTRIHGDHLKNLRELKKDYSKVKLLYIVCLEPKTRVTEDGIIIIPVHEFIKDLWEGKIFK